MLCSCAQIVPLSGGKKDVEPPKEVESIPKNGSTYFADNTITIVFDEFIQLTNLSSQLIVSPLMETPPEVLVKGKKLVIKLSGELKENTTYSLNFGNAISDITENNTYPNYKYVFSTGSYIDSLSYSGTVVNAFDLTKKEKVYVLLYDQMEDSVPLKELPRYIAITDKDGHFPITNIAHGEYKLFAINDINSNYLFDLPNEEIGFKNESIKLDSSSNNNLIYLFEEESGSQFLSKAENKVYGKVELTFNLPTKNLTVTPLNQFFKAPWYVEERNEQGDSLTLWLTTTEGVESLELLLKDGGEIIDTADIKIMDRKTFKDTSFRLKTNITGNFDLNKNIIMDIDRPFKSYIDDSIKLYEDSTLVTTAYFSDIAMRKFELAYDFKENTNYRLFIPPGTFEDLLGLKNDTLKVSFKTKKLSDYGNITLNINPYFSDNYILQLYKNKQLVREDFLKGTNKINYQYLLPGSYELKLIIDSNGDKKWTTGNYLNHLQPEKVIYYEKDITIRSNWDNEINWVIRE